MHSIVQYAVASLLVCLCMQTYCEAQLTFSPGWRTRILSKDVSARSESSGKRAGTWNSAYRWRFPKRDGEDMVPASASTSATLAALTGPSKVRAGVTQADLDTACRLLESYLTRLFFVDHTVRICIDEEA